MKSVVFSGSAVIRLVSSNSSCTSLLACCTQSPQHIDTHLLALHGKVRQSFRNGENYGVVCRKPAFPVHMHSVHGFTNA